MRDLLGTRDTRRTERNTLNVVLLPIVLHTQRKLLWCLGAQE